MKHCIDSPYTDGKAFLKKEFRNRTFRKENFQIWEHYYECEKTGKTFTTSAVDVINVNQVYNQYREKNGFLFPDQIKNIRHSYNLNAIQMAKILGLGVNMIGNYESGEMPSTSNAMLLNVIKDPWVFSDLFEKRYHFAKIGPKRRKKILEQIEKLKPRAKDPPVKWLPDVEIPSEFTGYKLPDFEKLAYMAIYFLSNLKHLFKVKLNKLLFYSDFFHFKETGRSISGMQYIAIKMGPVPNKYLHFYGTMVEENFLELLELPSVEFDQDIEKLNPIKPFKKELFTSEELEVMTNVLNSLGYKSRKEVVELSHNEKCWQEEEKKNGLISYQKYAFELTQI